MAIVDRLKSESKELVYKAILGKKYSDNDDFDVRYTPEEEILIITLKRLVLENEVGRAEDMLFSKSENLPTENIKYIAAEFYTMLMEMNDAELKIKQFSRQEIMDGITDIKKVLRI